MTEVRLDRRETAEEMERGEMGKEGYMQRETWDGRLDAERKD